MKRFDLTAKTEMVISLPPHQSPVGLHRSPPHSSRGRLWMILLLSLVLPLGAAQPGDADFPAASPSPRHTEKVAAVRSGHYDLVLIGDSITHTLGELGGKYEPLKAVWDKHFASRHALNLGHNGYRTENILWNLLNGELDFAEAPKVVMLLIGTNNTDDRHFPRVHTPEQIYAGTKAIVDLIRQRLPTTKVIVLRIFPRGGDSEKGVSPPAFNSSAKCIETCRRAGELTRQLADGQHVFWLDVNYVFLRPDGTINTDFMWDLLHPSPAGAEAWVQAAEPLLAQLMVDQPIVDPSKRLEPGRSFVFAKPGDGTRAYARTARANHANDSFQAEVTVTLKGGGGAGCAFFGLGKGEPNPQAYFEPTALPSLVLRLAPSDFAGGLLTVTVNGRESGGGSAPIGDGTHRLRFTWDAAGRRALFEVDKHWDGQLFHPDASASVSAAGIEFGNDGRLFVGGASGVSFRDFSVKALSTAQIQDAGFGDLFVNDPTAGTWLPVSPPAAAPAPDVDAFLGNLHGSLRLLTCWYVGSKLAASRAFTNGEVATASTRWTSSVRCQEVADDPHARELLLTFKLVSGAAVGAGVAAAFDFSGWSTNHYVLIPASVYNGNRNRIERRAYAAGLSREGLYRRDLPLTTGELPQLAPVPDQPSKIEVSVCNATTPAMCFFDRATRQGFILLAEQQSRFGDHGLMIEENRDRSRATFVLSAPGVRERKPEFIGFGPSPDHGSNWKAGDEVTLRLRVYAFPTPDIPGLLDKFMLVRKAVTGQNQPRDLIPFSEVTRLMARRIDTRFHDGPAFKFYCPENAAWISFGWVGGLMDTYPMLALGDAPRLERVSHTFDFAIPRAQGQAGYFYGALNHDGKVFGREGYDEHPEIVLTRKNGDVLFWMVKQFLLLKAQGRAAAIQPAWEQGTRRLAQAFVDTWGQCGQWGNFLNNQSGQVAVYNTTSGASAVGGLALAADYFRESAFLGVARQAAELYYQRDVVALGLTTGACADILQNADSESAAGFMTALMALYETTGDTQWLELSRNVANLTATWVVSYDYQLPPDTELAKLGAKLAGVVWASTQNKHGAPGSCTSSCDSLFKIYRATGDRRYAELLRDIAHAHAEGIKPGGEITERLTYCDADSRGSRGDGSTGWCELNGLLMALELPGLYARTDTGELFVFDHVRARLAKREGGRLTVELHNPTPYEASVAILSEDARQARQPLGYTAFLRWPHTEVKAGETKTVQLSPRAD
jgi:lysophospholipase L1-like esterase